MMDKKMNIVLYEPNPIVLNVAVKLGVMVVVFVILIRILLLKFKNMYVKMKNVIIILKRTWKKLFQNTVITAIQSENNLLNN